MFRFCFRICMSFFEIDVFQNWVQYRNESCVLFPNAQFYKVATRGHAFQIIFCSVRKQTIPWGTKSRNKVLKHLKDWHSVVSFTVARMSNEVFLWNLHQLTAENAFCGKSCFVLVYRPPAESRSATSRLKFCSMDGRAAYWQAPLSI